MAFENDREKQLIYDEGKDWIHGVMKAYDDEQYRTDFMYMQSLYPPMCREILDYIHEVCDQAEYEGSPMFDEFLDKVRFADMVEEIKAMAKHLENRYMPVLEEDEAMESMGHCVSCRGMDDWLENLISALLINELHYRRRRFYKHRRGLFPRKK